MSRLDSVHMYNYNSLLIGLLYKAYPDIYVVLMQPFAEKAAQKTRSFVKEIAAFNCRPIVLRACQHYCIYTQA